MASLSFAGEVDALPTHLTNVVSSKQLSKSNTVIFNENKFNSAFSELLECNAGQKLKIRGQILHYIFIHITFRTCLTDCCLSVY